MELEVHRLRIGNVKPSPVTTLASDFPSSSKVAVGRDNGTIEIMDSRSNFAVLCRIGGYDTFELQALQWSRASTESDVNQSRLFGLSRRGFLFEIDFHRGMIGVNLVDCYSSAAWCMSGCPRRDELAVGGEDGAVKIFTYETENRLEYLKTLPTTGSRILSLCYHPSKGLVVVGGEDGIIRGMNEVNGRNIFRLTSHSPTTTTTIIPAITSLLCLPGDSTMVSGDSHGRLRVWDLDKQVSTSEFMTSDGGTVNCLSAAATNTRDDASCNAVFAGLQDGRVLCLSRSQSSQGSQWGYSHSQRIGVHSTSALLSCSSSILNVLLAGGEDGRLHVLGGDSSTFHRSRPKDLSWLAPFATSSSCIRQVTVAGGQRVLVAALLCDRSINIWLTPLSLSPAARGGQPKLALTLSLKSECHVRAVSLSVQAGAGAGAGAGGGREGDVCSLFAVGGDGSLKAWTLSILAVQKGSSSSSVSAVKMDIPEICQGPAASLSPALACSRSGDRVACYDGSSRSLILLPLTSPSSLSVDSIIACDLRGGIDTHSRPGIGSTNKADYRLDSHLSHLSFSNNSTYLALASVTGAVTIVDVKEKKVHWRLRSSPCVNPIAAMSFVNDSTLVVLFPGNGNGNGGDSNSNKISVFDVSAMSLVKCWSGGAETVIPHSLRHALVGMTVLPSTDSANDSSQQQQQQQQQAEVIDSSNSSSSSSSGKKKKARRTGRNSLPAIDEESEEPPQPVHVQPVPSRGKGKGQVVVYSATQAVFIDLSQPLPAQAKAVGPFPASVANATVTTDATTANANEQQGQGQAQGQGTGQAFETARQRKRRVRFENNNNNDSTTRKRKRKASEGNLDDNDNEAAQEGNNGNFCLVDLYRDVLHMSFLPLPPPPPPQDKASSNGNSNSRPQLVVLESPWSRVAETLPDVLDRKRYGT